MRYEDDGRKDTGKEEEETGVMRNDVNDDEVSNAQRRISRFETSVVVVVAARCIVSGSQSSRAPEKKPEEKRK